ncbi:MAG TPA: ribose 5-phosphate isomerase B [Spirochaetota bacterium]|nr:ribose 5-phosphate isomerase B [Spirochaetota bacterium]HOM39155.1 ribose 5-phosphate isomerase B [Spirochaetota bacterium]HPQ48332.1 ribose 5-phosphate isomerase B [Spirochaetota bacterium]
MNKIGVASDHAGFDLKEKVIVYLKKNGYDVIDYGCYSTESTDYPDWIVKPCIDIRDDKIKRAIVICGSGVGASIVANKVRGIRAVLCFNEYVAEYSRRHNNSNVLVLAGRLTTIDLAERYINIWLNTEFEGGRHQKRIDKIKKIEEGYF